MRWGEGNDQEIMGERNENVVHQGRINEDVGVDEDVNEHKEGEGNQKSTRRFDWKLIESSR